MKFPQTTWLSGWTGTGIIMVMCFWLWSTIGKISAFQNFSEADQLELNLQGVAWCRYPIYLGIALILVGTVKYFIARVNEGNERSEDQP